MTNDPIVRRAGRVGGELFVIVVGVLLALWAENWREERAERGRTATYLEELTAEVSATMAGLNESIRLDSLLVLRTGAAADLLRTARSGESDELARPLPFLQLTTFTPTMPTLGQLVGSTDLRLVDPPQLRRALRSTAAEQERNAQLLPRSLERLVALHGDLVTSAERAWWALGRQERGASPVTQLALQELAGDPDFTATLVKLQGLAGLRLVRKNALRTELEMLSALLPAVPTDIHP
jgi:hypothetical protein